MESLSILLANDANFPVCIQWMNAGCCRAGRSSFYEASNGHEDKCNDMQSTLCHFLMSAIAVDRRDYLLRSPSTAVIVRAALCDGLGDFVSWVQAAVKQEDDLRKKLLERLDNEKEGDGRPRDRDRGRDRGRDRSRERRRAGDNRPRGMEEKDRLRDRDRDGREGNEKERKIHRDREGDRGQDEGGKNRGSYRGGRYDIQGTEEGKVPANGSPPRKRERHAYEGERGATIKREGAKILVEIDPTKPLFPKLAERKDSEWASLPVLHYRKKIVEMVKNNKVCLQVHA